MNFYLRLGLQLLLILTAGCTEKGQIQLPIEIQELENLQILSEADGSNSLVTFKKDVEYGDSNDPVIGRIGDVAVDKLGRVFIADVQLQVINVYDARGQFISQLGRKGRGPEEFTYIKNFRIHDSLLYVADANFGINKINIYSLKTLSGIKTVSLGKNPNKIKLPLNSYPGIQNITVKSDGTYFAEYVSNDVEPIQKWQNVEQKGSIYSLDSSGIISSRKLFEFTEAILVSKPRGLFAPIKPFWGTAFTGLTSDDRFILASPENFIIKVFDSEGRYLNAFYYPIKKIELTKESAIEAKVHEYYIQNMKYMNHPRFWPVIKEFKIDNRDRLWVATTIEDMNEYRWLVLSSNGKLLTQFSMSRTKLIKEIKDDFIYVLESNEDKGIQKIIRYRFDITQP